MDLPATSPPRVALPPAATTTTTTATAAQPGAPPLSDEQRAFVDVPLAANDLVHVSARAGSGKTSTLVAYAKRYPQQRLLYIVYNQDARAEAERRMPRNCVPRTFHSIALQVHALRRPCYLRANAQTSACKRTAPRRICRRLRPPAL